MEWYPQYNGCLIMKLEIGTYLDVFCCFFSPLSKSCKQHGVIFNFLYCLSPFIPAGGIPQAVCVSDLDAKTSETQA